jgi:CheY-like chemotaxis protein
MKQVVPCRPAGVGNFVGGLWESTAASEPAGAPPCLCRHADARLWGKSISMPVPTKNVRRAADRRHRIGREEPLIDRKAATVDEPGARPVILVVDDDGPVREITAEMLEECGFDVVQAASGRLALHELGNGQRIDLMLVDVAMPSMNGREAARGAHALKPSLPVLFVTGYADVDLLRDIEDRYIIQKPFRGADIASKIRWVLGAA